MLRETGLNAIPIRTSQNGNVIIDAEYISEVLGNYNVKLKV